MIFERPKKWLYGMRVVSVGVLITLGFFLLYNGGIGIVFDLKSIMFLFTVEEFIGSGMSRIITLILCVIMLSNALLGLVVKTPRLCAIAAFFMLIFAVVSLGCIYYYMGLNPGFSLLDIKYEVFTMLLAVCQIVCLIGLKN